MVARNRKAGGARHAGNGRKAARVGGAARAGTAGKTARVARADKARRVARVASNAATASARAAGKTTPKTTTAPVRQLLYVCRECVFSDAEKEREGKRQGQYLFEAIEEVIERDGLPEGMILRGVFCLNGCPKPCNVSLRAAGKHALRFSQMIPADAGAVIEAARAYAASADGDLDDEALPPALRGTLSARTPPAR